MGSITIRNVDDEIKRGARLAGVRHGRSMEAEIKALLERTYRSPEDARAERIRAMSGAEFVAHLVAAANGATLDIPDREHEEIEFPDL
ncbi:plasmid stabilization protein [Sphingomonas sp.]|uniref:FitA-like ribbon-helix-helix domain-containing protein n=1 Tax=Sphingomonas sp. TaxID=28214 RepID=UPI0033408E0F